MNAPTYMFDAKDKPSLALHPVPLVEATTQSLDGYGYLVDSHDNFEIEIVRWPAQGWRPVDEDTGDEGGWVEGIFSGEWKGDVLYGSNEAVGRSLRARLVGRSTNRLGRKPRPCPAIRFCLWHMNYHPDGGQLFLSPRPETFCRSVGPARRRHQS